jgi:hypothetical protein
MTSQLHRPVRSLVLASIVMLGCSGTPAVDAGDERAASDVPARTDTSADVVNADIGLDAIDVASDVGNRDVGPFDLGTTDLGTTDTGSDVPRTDVAVAADVVADASTCTVSGAYPAGPYGTAIGSVMTNYTWRGLTMPAGTTEPSTGALASVRMSELRNRGCRYAIVHMATPG